jgi:hypothetical protein
MASHQIDVSQSTLAELVQALGDNIPPHKRGDVLSGRLALDLTGVSVTIAESARAKAKNGISDTELVRRVMAGGTADRRAGETNEQFVARKMAEARGEQPSPSPTAALDEGDETADAMDRLFGVVGAEHITHSQSSEPRDDGDEIADSMDRLFGPVRPSAPAHLTSRLADEHRARPPSQLA